MATEQSSMFEAPSGSIAKWASWIAALVGLWVVVSPFALTGSIESGIAMWSNLAAGALILVFAGYGAYAIRSAAAIGPNASGEWSGWIASLAGLWIGVSPFLLTGSIANGTPMWSNVGAGLVALVLAGYAGYFTHARE